MTICNRFLSSVFALVLCHTANAQFFSNPTSIPNAGSDQELIAVGLVAYDIDFDGDDDLVLSLRYADEDLIGSEFHVATNNNNEGLSVLQLFNSSVRIRSLLACYDMDNNGSEEIIYKGVLLDDWYVGGMFWEVIEDEYIVYEAINDIISFYTCVDVNGDGLLDIINDSSDNGQYIHIQNEDNDFDHIGLSLPSIKGPILSTDIDGDGDTDIVVKGGFGGPSPIDGSYVRLNDGEGNFNQIYLATDIASRNETVNLTDFNGDGAIDLVFAPTDQEEFVVCTDLANPLSTITTLELPFHDCQELIVADSNNDGVQDYFIFGEDELFVYQAYEQNFELAQVVNIMPSMQFWQLHDLNNDGKKDLSAHRSDTGDLVVYWNTANEFACGNPSACNYTPLGTSELACSYACVSAIDLNADQIINIYDLLLLLSELGCTGEACQTDLNQDNITNLQDLFLLLAWFGS